LLLSATQIILDQSEDQHKKLQSFDIRTKFFCLIFYSGESSPSIFRSFSQKVLLVTSKQSILNPASNRRLLWNMFVFIAILYNATTIPMRLSYQDLWAKRDLYGLYSFDYFFDIVYAIDILFHMRTAYLNKGVTVTNREKILDHYLRVIRNFLSFLTRQGWFILELISVLPFDLFVWNVWAHSALRINRMLKLARMNVRCVNLSKL
jgi:hypothetical protein